MADDLLFSLTLGDAEEDGAALAVDTAAGPSTAPSETPRERRIRKAREEAKRSYKAQVDSDGWFCEDRIRQILANAEHAPQLVANPDLQAAVEEALGSNKRAGPKLEWTLAHLYATCQYHQALALSICCIRAEGICVEGILAHSIASAAGSLVRHKAGQAPGLDPSKKGKKAEKSTNARLSHVGYREVLDIAMRSATVLLDSHASANAEASAALGDIARCLVVLAVQEALPLVFNLPEAQVEELVPSESFAERSKNVHWTVHAGIVSAMGDLCFALGYASDALEAWSVVLASRGSLPRLYAGIVRALGQLGTQQHPPLRRLARACASAALMSCKSHAARSRVADELGRCAVDLQGGTDGAPAPPSDDADAELIRACHATGASTMLALVALVHGALSKKGAGAAELARRYDEYLERATAAAAHAHGADAADEDANEGRTFKSVRNL